MTRSIAHIDALEIIDSRGNPTLRVMVQLADGTAASADVPSGASTGQFEAHELRDDDKKRFGGKGTTVAVANVRKIIAPALQGRDPLQQVAIDRLLVELDGTPNKSKLGANATVGVSMAVARVAASAQGVPLYKHLGGATARRLPVPMMNIINGGKHAGTKLEFQEFMIVPRGAPSFAEAMRYGAETYQSLKALLHDKGLATGVGDEGGFAPELSSNEQACELIVEAIRKAGYEPGKDIAIALDPAATSFYEDGGYAVPSLNKEKRSSKDMVELFAHWVSHYPIVSIEDGLAEDDWKGFKQLTERLGATVQMVGDDIFVTNPKFIRKGIAEGTTNAVLIKLNQIGTVTETIEAIELCREAGWGYVISHRSGETADAFIADLAVAMGGGQIKTGAPCRGERLAKYNRLLEIEHELGSQALFSDPYTKAKPA
jgi:enolase